jgi:hypothetical protein
MPWQPRAALVHPSASHCSSIGKRANARLFKATARGSTIWEEQVLSARGFKALRILHIHGVEVHRKRPRGFK